MALSPQAAVSALETTGDPSVIPVSHHHSCILHSSPISLLLFLRCRPLKLPSSSPLPPPVSFYLHTPLKLPLLFHLSFSTLCPLSVPKLPLFSHPSPSPSSLLSCITYILMSSNFPPSPRFQLASTSTAVLTLPLFPLLPPLLPSSLLPIFPLHGTVAL